MEQLNRKSARNGERCGMCLAEFEIWLNNSMVAEEKREKMTEHILEYCPVCSRADEKQ